MSGTRFPLVATAALRAACSPGGDEPAGSAETAAEEPPAVQRYAAEAFYATTTHGLAGRHTWSPDDRELLLTSDETGIFNVYALSVADGGKRALTSSTTDSTYAVSWFPNDARVNRPGIFGGSIL